jgi:hypothetical protein
LKNNNPILFLIDDQSKGSFVNRRFPRSESTKADRKSFLSLRGESNPVIQIPIPNQSAEKKTLRRASVAPNPRLELNSLSVFSPPLKMNILGPEKNSTIDNNQTEQSLDQNETPEGRTNINNIPNSAAVIKKNMRVVAQIAGLVSPIPERKKSRLKSTIVPPGGKPKETSQTAKQGAESPPSKKKAKNTLGVNDLGKL